MDYDSSSTRDTVMNSSNIAFLRGCENLASSRHQQVPASTDGLRLPEGYFAEADGIYFYGQDDDEDQEGPVLLIVTEN